MVRSMVYKMSKNFPCLCNCGVETISFCLLSLLLGGHSTLKQTTAVTMTVCEFETKRMLALHKKELKQFVE